MTTTTRKPTKPYIKRHLAEKRAELIWALAEQDYAQVDLAEIFSIPRQEVWKIIQKMPDGWKSPWFKIQK